MKLPLLPKNIARIGQDEFFAFACHKRVACFTHCCRQLDLALTPYDVLRLKNNLGMDSAAFLERYVIMEQEEDDAFPRFYLTMVDDGKVSCVFLSAEGCAVYEHRPGACRAYPMGRASMRTADNTIEDHYVLLNEEHCKGFDEPQEQTPTQYCREQGLDTYNRMNDALIPVLQHEKLRQGMRPDEEEIRLFTLALYDLDTFRTQLFANALEGGPTSAEKKRELENDETLLLFAIDWLKERLFKE